MQTEGPIYPDFDLPKDERQLAIGEIGWGISKPGLVAPSNAIQQAREKYYINYFDNTKN